MQWAYRWRNVGGPTMDVIRFDHVHARILGLTRAFCSKRMVSLSSFEILPYMYVVLWRWWHLSLFHTSYEETQCLINTFAWLYSKARHLSICYLWNFYYIWYVGWREHSNADNMFNDIDSNGHHSVINIIGNAMKDALESNHLHILLSFSRSALLVLNKMK